MSKQCTSFLNFKLPFPLYPKFDRKKNDIKITSNEGTSTLPSSTVEESNLKIFDENAPAQILSAGEFTEYIDGAGPSILEKRKVQVVTLQLCEQFDIFSSNIVDKVISNENFMQDKANIYKDNLDDVYENNNRMNKVELTNNLNADVTLEEQASVTPNPNFCVETQYSTNSETENPISDREYSKLEPSTSYSISKESKNSLCNFELFDVEDFLNESGTTESTSSIEKEEHCIYSPPKCSVMSSTTDENVRSDEVNKNKSSSDEFNNLHEHSAANCNADQSEISSIRCIQREKTSTHSDDLIISGSQSSESIALKKDIKKKYFTSTPYGVANNCEEQVQSNKNPSSSEECMTVPTLPTNSPSRPEKSSNQQHKFSEDVIKFCKLKSSVSKMREIISMSRKEGNVCSGPSTSGKESTVINNNSFSDCEEHSDSSESHTDDSYSQAYVIEDKLDAPPEFHLLRTIFREIKPMHVVIGGFRNQQFFRVLKELTKCIGNDFHNMSSSTNSSTPNNSSSSNRQNENVEKKCQLHISPAPDFKYILCKQRILRLNTPTFSSAPPPSTPNHDLDSETHKMARLSAVIDVYRSVAATRALGGLLKCVERTVHTFLESRSNEILPEDLILDSVPVLGLHSYTLEDYCYMDSVTASDLHLISAEDHPASTKKGKECASKEGLSILALLSKNATSMSRPVLKRVLQRPLTCAVTLQRRYTFIAWAIDPINTETVGHLRSSLKAITNVQHVLRLLHRATLGVKEWKSLYQILFNAIVLAELCQRHNNDIQILQEIGSCLSEGLYEAAFLITQIFDAVESEREGRFVVKPGVDAQLDEDKKRYHGISAIMRQVADMELKLLPTQLESCSMIYMPHVGYLLSIAIAQHPNGDIPLNLQHLQFIFVTEDVAYYKSDICKELDIELGDIHVDIANNESRIMLQLVEQLITRSGELVRLVDRLLYLDALLALSIVTKEEGWVKPELVETPCLKVTKGRHPLYQLCCLDTPFVPNDVSAGSSSTGGKNIALVTGPNGSGKTVYLKMIGVVTLLAQIGCFVPAESMVYKPFSSLITVCQATSSVTSCFSSFMLELNRLSRAVEESKSHSLVLIDEFGASTYEHDGMALLVSTIHYWIKQTNQLMGNQEEATDNETQMETNESTKVDDAHTENCLKNNGDDRKLSQATEEKGKEAPVACSSILKRRTNSYNEDCEKFKSGFTSTSAISVEGDSDEDDAGSVIIQRYSGVVRKRTRFLLPNDTSKKMKTNMDCEAVNINSGSMNDNIENNNDNHDTASTMNIDERTNKAHTSNSNLSIRQEAGDEKRLQSNNDSKPQTTKVHSIDSKCESIQGDSNTSSSLKKAKIQLPYSDMNTKSKSDLRQKDVDRIEQQPSNSSAVYEILPQTTAADGERHSAPLVFISTHMLSLHDLIQYPEAVMHLMLETLTNDGGELVALYQVGCGRIYRSEAANVALAAGMPPLIIQRLQQVESVLREGGLPEPWTPLQSCKEYRNCQKMLEIVLQQESTQEESFSALVGGLCDAIRNNKRPKELTHDQSTRIENNDLNIERGTTKGGRKEEMSEKEASQKEKEVLTSEKEASTSEKEALTREKEALTSEKEASTSEKEASTSEKDASQSEKEERSKMRMKEFKSKSRAKKE